MINGHLNDLNAYDVLYSIHRFVQEWYIPYIPKTAVSLYTLVINEQIIVLYCSQATVVVTVGTCWICTPQVSMMSKFAGDITDISSHDTLNFPQVWSSEYGIYLL